MKALYRSLLIVPALALFLSGTITWGTLSAQVKDTVTVIQNSTPTPYRYCYDFRVQNRHPVPVTIAEFSVRIASGRARLISGFSSSPNDWTLLQSQTSVAWASSTVAAEITSGNALSGFYVCANDTGVIRLVWETRSADSVLSSDTIAIACRRTFCDELFPRPIPGMVRAVTELDLANGNGSGLAITQFSLRMLSAVPRFDTTINAAPAGWARVNARPDSMWYSTNTKPLLAGKFIEGFRIGLQMVQGDSAFVEYLTQTPAGALCRDTLLLFWPGLLQNDSLRISVQSAAGDSCCHTATLRNLHQPTGQLTGFSVKILLPNANWESLPTPAAGWTLAYGTVGGDSVLFTKQGALFNQLDSSVFRNLCVNNRNAGSDTIPLRWTSYYKGVPVTTGVQRLVCVRPLRSCDILRIAADTMQAQGARCLRLRLFNNNSRKDTIERLLVRISNPGVPRELGQISPPSPWFVENSGKDSATFLGLMLPGDSADFVICAGTQNNGSFDPLRVAWTTIRLGGGLICRDTALMFVSGRCDSVAITDILPGGSGCCYTLTARNNNSRGRIIDSLKLSVLTDSVVLATPTAPSGWAARPGDGNRTVVFSGGRIPVDSALNQLGFCLRKYNGSALEGLSRVVWSTMSGQDLLCRDTLFTGCTGGTDLCDSLDVVSIEPGNVVIGYGLQMRNVHTPATPVTALQLRITGGSGQFIGGQTRDAAADWTVALGGQDTITFRAGTPVAPAARLRTLVATVIPKDFAKPVTADYSVFNGAVLLCSGTISLSEKSLGAHETVAAQSALLTMQGIIPNPASGTATVHYRLNAPAHITLSLRDAMGRLVTQRTLGIQSQGSHTQAINLDGMVTGVYFITVATGPTRATGSVSVVR